jgi:hypothetical protein
MAAGVLRLFSVIQLGGVSGRWWPIAVLAVATQLLLYREPEGAFEAPDTSRHKAH